MESNVTLAAPAERGRASIALANVFLSPSRSFQEIARGASWLWGFVVSVGLAVLAAVLQRPFAEILARAQLSTLPEEQRAAAERFVGVQATTQIILAPALAALLFLLSALLYLGIGRAMGLRTRYKPMFAGMCYAGIITGIRGVVYAFVLRQRAASGEVSSMADMPRFGLDLIGGEGFVRGILSSFDIFNLWWMVILVYGVAVLSGRSPRQAMPAAILAGTVWLLLSGMLMGLAFIYPRR